MPDQVALDARNAAFWNELCGSGLARSLGITEITVESLRRFDEAYLATYPYLTRYVDALDVAGRDTLEIGLGFGTLGEQLARRGARYHGADIAEGPVAMMRDRLSWHDLGDPNGVVVGSALELPWPDERFDIVVSIGCLHHTGDLVRALGEVDRVLRPGGRVLAMLYNRHSLRQLAQRVRDWREGRNGDAEARLRARYDANATGEAAPFTEYVTRGDARRLFSRFASVAVDVQNMDTYVVRLPRRTLVIPREHLLGNVGRVAGLDLYVVAQK